MRRRLALFLSALLLSSALAGEAALAQGRAEIPWPPGQSITRTSVDDDIRNILRSILQAGGFSVIFRPGVEGRVSFRLEEVPLAAAFRQLVEENGLDFHYNAETNTAVVYPKGTGTAAERRFIALGPVPFALLEQALVNFGLPRDKVVYDPRTDVVSIRATPEETMQIESLIETLRAQEQGRRAQSLEARQQELQTRRAELTQRLYEEYLAYEVKVIPLRFADVGPTVREFQGRSITVPGIIETLQAFLGEFAALPADLPAAGGAVRRARLEALGLAAPAPDPAAATGPAALPEADLRDLGTPSISIDRRTNSIIVRGTPQAIAAVEEVVRQLDRPLQMIEIEVVIATAQIGVAEELGISWRGGVFGGGNRIGGGGAGDSGTTGGQIDGDELGDDDFNVTSLLPESLGPQSTIASFVLLTSKGFLQAQLQALAEENKAQVLSAPRLVTLDNIPARITRSQNIFVQVDSGSALTGVGLEEVQTGLTLDITPSIVPSYANASENLIRLTLTAENSQPGSGAFGQIDVRAQEVQTQVLVPNGATFVIGGLFDDTQREGQSGVPLLKDIPVLGQLFRVDRSNKSLGETIFFITPRIVPQQPFLPQDVAVRIGSPDYIRRQRLILESFSEEMQQGPDRPFPNAVRTLREGRNSTILLEEDE